MVLFGMGAFKQKYAMRPRIVDNVAIEWPTLFAM
jgi:hypothetical protein